MNPSDSISEGASRKHFISAPALALAVSGLLTLFACSGGGMGSYGSAGSPPPAGTSVTLAGTLTGTSTSPQFNGQPIQAASATVTMNGLAASAARLQPGVVLVGKGTQDSHGINLQSADLRTELKGPITSIDAAATTFKVLDMVVTVNAQTQLQQEMPDDSFSTLTFADLAVGDFVSVFGTPQTGGGILATRVERETPGMDQRDELRGVVSALDTTAKTFMLGTHLVAYGTANISGTLADGVRVEVEGTLSGTTFDATRVRVEDAMEPGDGEEVEISGPLSSLDATAKTFMLLTFKVDYSAASVEGTLAEGATVEVEGVVSATDPTLLMATKVEIRSSDGGMTSGG